MKSVIKHLETEVYFRNETIKNNNFKIKEIRRDLKLHTKEQEEKITQLQLENARNQEELVEFLQALAKL